MPGLLETTDWESVNGLYSEMESWGRDMLANSGVPEDQVRLTRTADMRLVGQIHEINVPIPDDTLAQNSTEVIESDFHQIYQQLYSRRNLSIPIEVQNWRLLVSGPQPILNLQEQIVEPNADARVALNGSRPAYFANANGFVECPVYHRYKLAAGAEISGPAIIEEEESTTIIRPGDSASIDRWLNLLIRVNP